MNKSEQHPITEDFSALELTDSEKQIVLKLIHRIGFWFKVERFILTTFFILLGLGVLLFLVLLIFPVAG